MHKGHKGHTGHTGHQGDRKDEEQRPQRAAGDHSSDLAARAAAGDRGALDELLRRLLPGLRAFVRLRASPIVRAHEQSEDLVQSTCREALANLDRFRHGGEAGFRRWLYATALRKVLNRDEHWRAGKRDARPEAAPPTRASEAETVALLEQYRRFSTPSQKAIAREELERVEAAFAKLSGDQREVILLARVGGLPHAEIAAAMNRSEIAVRTLLHRALARLAGLLEDADEGAR